MRTITETEYKRALIFSKLKKSGVFEDSMKEIEKEIKIFRAENFFETDMQESYRKKWLINGYAGCLHFIRRNINLVDEVNKGLIKVVSDDEK